jgi:ABC-type polysaccharide/polyol phosphate export permease
MVIDIRKLLDDFVQIFYSHFLLIALPFQWLIVGSDIALHFADIGFQLRNSLQLAFPFSP